MSIRIPTSIIMVTAGLQGDDSPRMEQISDAFAQSSPDWSAFSGWGLLIGAVVLAGGLAVLVASLKARDLRRHGSCTRRLARGAGLSLIQCAWLNRAARREGYLNAAGMILSRGTFEHVARARVSQAGRPGRMEARFLAIRRLVHGE